MNMNSADKKHEMEKKKEQSDWIPSPPLNLRPVVADGEKIADENETYLHHFDRELSCLTNLMHLGKLQRVSLSDMPTFCKYISI